MACPPPFPGAAALGFRSLWLAFGPNRGGNFLPRGARSHRRGALLDEAEVEHATAKDLIRQISEMSPDDDLYDARVTVLGEYIDHHVKEEREEIFVKARKARLDLVAMADELSQRKMELLEDDEAEKA